MSSGVPATSAVLCPALMGPSAITGSSLRNRAVSVAVTAMRTSQTQPWAQASRVELFDPWGPRCAAPSMRPRTKAVHGVSSLGSGAPIGECGVGSHHRPSYGSDASATTGTSLRSRSCDHRDLVAPHRTMIRHWCTQPYRGVRPDRHSPKAHRNFRASMKVYENQ